jgi:hypothetical protein
MNDKTTPKKGMGRIGDLDFFKIRVLEGGIKKWFLSTLWIMLSCGPFSGSVYAMGSCYA